MVGGSVGGRTQPQDSRVQEIGQFAEQPVELAVADRRVVTAGDIPERPSKGVRGIGERDGVALTLWVPAIRLVVAA